MANKIIELKPSLMKLAVADAIRSNVVAIVLSSPGMGKSDVITQAVTEDLKMRLVDERASMMDLTDWRGVPDIDRKRRRTTWFPPDFLPEEADPPTVVFFDEITQTPTTCQPPLYQLLLTGRLGSAYTKPASTRWVCAGNNLDDGTFVNKLGSALRDRLVFLHMIHDLDDWCNWAIAHDIEPAVIAYNRFKRTSLYAFDKKEECSPTARGWEMVSRLVKNCKNNGLERQALIAGKVGYGAMIEYLAFEQIFTKVPSIDAIMLNPDTAQVPDDSKPELRYAVANALSVSATPKNFDRVATYLDRMPEEYGIFAVKIAARREPKLTATPTFTKWAVKHSAALSA